MPPERTSKDETLWTIGHSTRAVDAFIRLLKAYDISHLVDVRIIPYSRRNPQFNTDTLALSLLGAQVSYQRVHALGGRRIPKHDSLNVGWRNAGFRGYADYMQTEAFAAGLEELIGLATVSRVAVMCAEAVPWRCHRSLIADALVSRGWTVQHILTATSVGTHALTSFAQIVDGQLIYPASPDANKT